MSADIQQMLCKSFATPPFKACTLSLKPAGRHKSRLVSVLSLERQITTTVITDYSGKRCKKMVSLEKKMHH